MKKGETAGRTVAVEGLQDLMRIIRKMDKEARKEVRAKLRDVGKIVADEAKAQAAAQGLYRTGLLIRRIRPKLTSRSIQIVDTAMKRSPKYPSGYNYPKRYEYEKGGARAFMRPALEAKQEEAVRRFEEIFDELEREWANG